MVPERPQQMQAQNAEPCRRCGVVDVPTLSAGTGPHAIRADCSHCHKFIQWISVLAPSERMARKVKQRFLAMAKRAPSEAQLSFLASLGYTGSTPETMADASAKIEALQRGKG